MKRMKMNKHPVLLQVKESVKEQAITVIELDLYLEKIQNKQEVIDRIKDLIRNL